MANKEIKKQETAQEEVQETLSAAGQWIIKYQDAITWTITAIVVVILGIMALNTYVFKPKALEASNENAKAVVYFMQGDFAKALAGDDADCLGFEEIASKYSLYQQGKLAALYAGICYYEQGEYEEAAKYLKKFKANDLVIAPAASMMLGDAYVELDELGKAVSAYKAAAEDKDALVAPMALKKLGFVYLEEGKNADAKKAFARIKSDFPASQEAQDIEKYIAVAEAE